MSSPLVSACPSPYPEVVRGSHGCCSIKGNEGTSPALPLAAVLDTCPAGAGFSPVQCNEPQPWCTWGILRRSCSHSCVTCLSHSTKFQSDLLLVVYLIIKLHEVFVVKLFLSGILSQSWKCKPTGGCALGEHVHSPDQTGRGPTAAFANQTLN